MQESGGSKKYWQFMMKLFILEEPLMFLMLYTINGQPGVLYPCSKPGQRFLKFYTYKMFKIIYFLPNASKIDVTNWNEKGGRLKSTGKKINTLLNP